MENPRCLAGSIANRLAPLEAAPKHWFIAGADGLRLLGYDPEPLGPIWNAACHVYLEDSIHPPPPGILAPASTLPASMNFCLGRLRGEGPAIRLFSAHRYASPLTFLKKVATDDGAKVQIGRLKAQARIFSQRAVEVIESQDSGENIQEDADSWIEQLRLWQSVEWRSGDRWMASFLTEMIKFYQQVSLGLPLRSSQQVRIGKRAGVY